MPTFSISEAVRFGWDRFKAHFLFLWAVLGILWGVSFIFGLLDGITQDGVSKSLLSFISFIIGIVLQLGAIRIYLTLVDSDTEEKLKALFSEYRLFFHYLGAAILYGIIVVLGLIAFIVPGIYFILKYQFFSYLIVDKRLGVFDALKQSAVITKDVKWKLLGFAFVLCGINLLGVLAFLVGLAVSVPVSVLAYVYVYRVLSKHLTSTREEVTTGAAAAEQPITVLPGTLPEDRSEAR